jgi:hypothetical protein
MALPITVEQLDADAQQIFATAQNIYGYYIKNPNNYTIYVKFYDKLAVNVNPITDVPALVVTIAALATASDSSTHTFSTAISMRCTEGSPNDDRQPPANWPEITLNITAEGSGSGDALVANPLSQFAATTSAQLAGVITNETGTGSVVFSSGPTLVAPILGTPASGTLTNCTLPVGGVTGLGTGIGTFLATPSSANLAASLTDETGTGAAVFANAPTLIGPALGTPVSGNLSNCTGVASGNDGNSNYSANNFLPGYATTATAAGTTTLTVASAREQVFTGSTTQNCKLPVTSTLVLGTSFIINNTSTGTVTIQSSGSNTVTTVLQNATAKVMCILTSGTSAASWLVVSNSGLLTSGGALGTPSSGTATNITGLPIAGITGTGVGVATALGTQADSSGGFATTNGTATLTNKRITPRITTISSSGTPTVNTDNCDCVTITAQAAAITSMTTNLTGTPSNFDQLEFRILDNGTARAITWGASFVAGPTALPTTTTLSKALHVYFEWDSVATKWVCVSAGSDA